MSVRHTAIVCENIKKMTKFYESLGFEKHEHYEIKGSFINELLDKINPNLIIIKLKSKKDNSIIELIKYKYEKNARKKQELHEQGIAHIAITVDDLDKVFETLTLQGIKFVSHPLLSKKDKVKVCFCQDPEQNFLELVEDL